MTFFSVENLLEGSESEVESMVKGYCDSATELAKFLVVLKQLVINWFIATSSYDTLQKLRKPQG